MLKSKVNNESGAALIELVVVVPFLAIITLLCVAFIQFVNTYSLSSQSIREAAQLGSMYPKTPVGSEYCTCIYNNRDGGCESGCPTQQSFESQNLNCSYNEANHHPDCAHKIALNKIRRYLLIITKPKDLKELNLTTRCIQDANEVIFEVELDGDHEGFLNVFGDRVFDIRSYGFIREDDIPTSPSDGPSDGPSEPPPLE